MAIGNVSMFGGKTQEAHQAFERARVLASQLVTDAPNAADSQATLADVLSNQGMLLMSQAINPDETVKDSGKLKEAQAAHRKALDLRKLLSQAQPGNADLLVNLASSFNHLANTFQLQGETGFADAELNYREALGLLEPLAVAFPGVPGHRQDIAQIFNNLNELYAKQKRWDQAETLARRAVDDFARLEKNFPSIPEHSAELSTALERLAHTLRLQGKKAEANDRDYAAAIAAGRASTLWNEPAQREEWAVKAVAALQRLRTERFFADPRHRDRLAIEPAFQNLRSRSDYGELGNGPGTRGPPSRRK
jgi:tetratricopeptide (TPR) repeat protein